MSFICTNCNSTIEETEVNVVTDLAQCKKCGSVLKLSSLVAQRDLKLFEKEITSPPKGSRIEMINNFDGSVKLVLPPRGFQSQSIFQTVFSVVWISFVAFWTWGASHATILFSLFSIPFWLVGFYMIKEFVDMLYETKLLL